MAFLGSRSGPVTRPIICPDCGWRGSDKRATPVDRNARVAIRALLLAGVAYDPDIVIKAAGLDLHREPEWLRHRLAIIAVDVRKREAGR